MLARSFKSATELGITKKQWNVLVTLLHALERGEIAPRFWDMNRWDFCFGGWSERLGAKYSFEEVTPSGASPFAALFHPSKDGVKKAYKATPAQAAIALSNWLTTGEPRWREAMRAHSSAMRGD